MSACVKCGEDTENSFHSEVRCSYRGFLKSMEEKKYIAIPHSQDLYDIQAEGRLPVESLKIPINSQDKYAGHIRLAYVPRWVKEGISTYHKNGFSGSMTLVEFMQKMFP